MASLNKVILIGNLGRDPERQEAGNSYYAKFSVATNENYKDKNGEWQKSTQWHNIKAWGPIADRCLQQLRKGSNVYVEGSLRSFKNKDDITSWEVRAITVKALDSRNQQNQNQWQGGDQSAQNAWGNQSQQNSAWNSGGQQNNNNWNGG